MNADPDQRFADAGEMQREWRKVSDAAQQDEPLAPLGRRFSERIGKLLGR